MLLSRGLNHVLQDQVSDLEFPNFQLLVVCGLDLLLVGYNADLRLLSLNPLTDLQRQAELGVVLILIHFFHLECRYADVDWDDCFCPVYQRERGFASGDALGGPVGSEHSREFFHLFAFNFVQTLQRLSRMVRLLILAWPLS